MDVVIRHCPCLRSETDNVRVLDYRHCSLLEVPSEVFVYERTLEELYLDSNQIRELPRALFHCHGLKKLLLSDNEICILPPAIASLINVEELDIGKNGILHIPENIKCCKYLSIIEASVNPLGKLPDGFTQLLNLTELYLNDTFLEYLPGNFGRLSKLKILEVRENHLQSLPKSMSRLTELQRLDIGQNDFAELPDIGSLTSLTELWCDCNQISLIPPDIGNLHKLTYLDASKNRIESIPPEIDGCGSLVDLCLSSNLIQELPSSIGRLRSLTTFKIDDNQLTSLPYSIGGLICLTEMIISTNDLESLPSSIGFLRNLSMLNADENFLEDLPPEVGSCSGLTILSVRTNRLITIPDELGHIPHLRIINLCDNRIQFLPYSIMKLKELSALWLTENQTKPLIPLQSDIDVDTGQRVLTCFLFPQQSQPDSEDLNSDADSFHPSLWEEERQRRQQITFNFNEVPEKPSQRFIRAPTPYPKEMKGHLRHARNQAMKQKGVNGDAPPFEERGVDVVESESETGPNSKLHSQGSGSLDMRVKEARIGKTCSSLPSISNDRRFPYKYDKIKTTSQEEMSADMRQQPLVVKSNEPSCRQEISNKGVLYSPLNVGTSSGYISPTYGDLITNSQPIIASRMVVKEAKYKKNVSSSSKIDQSNHQVRASETDPDSGYRSDYEPSLGNKLNTSRTGYLNTWEMPLCRTPDQYVPKDGYTSDIESYSSAHIRNNENYPSIRSLEPSPSLPNFNLHTPDKSIIPNTPLGQSTPDSRNDLSQRCSDSQNTSKTNKSSSSTKQSLPHCRRDLFGGVDHKVGLPSSQAPPVPPRPPKKIYLGPPQPPPYPTLPPYKPQGVASNNSSPSKLPPPYHSTPQSRKMGFPDYNKVLLSEESPQQSNRHNNEGKHSVSPQRTIMTQNVECIPHEISSAKYENVNILHPPNELHNNSELENHIYSEGLSIPNHELSHKSLLDSYSTPLSFPIGLDSYHVNNKVNHAMNQSSLSMPHENSKSEQAKIRPNTNFAGYPHNIPYESMNSPTLNVPGPQATSSAQPSPQENDQNQNSKTSPVDLYNCSRDNLPVINSDLGLERVNSWLSNGFEATNSTLIHYRNDEVLNNSWDFKDYSIYPSAHSQVNKPNLPVPPKPKRLHQEQSILNPDNTLVSVTAYPWSPNGQQNNIWAKKEPGVIANQKSISSPEKENTRNDSHSSPKKYVANRNIELRKSPSSAANPFFYETSEMLTQFNIPPVKKSPSPVSCVTTSLLQPSLIEKQNLSTTHRRSSPTPYESSRKNNLSSTLVQGSINSSQAPNSEWPFSNNRIPPSHFQNKNQLNLKPNYLSIKEHFNDETVSSEMDKLPLYHSNHMVTKSKSSPSLHRRPSLENDFNQIKTSLSPPILHQLPPRSQMSSLPSLVTSLSNTPYTPLSNHYSLRNTPQASPQKSTWRKSYSQAEIRILEETFLNLLKPDEPFDPHLRTDCTISEGSTQMDPSSCLRKKQKEICFSDHPQLSVLPLNTHSNFDAHYNLDSPVSLEIPLFQKTKTNTQTFIPIVHSARSTPSLNESQAHGTQENVKNLPLEIHHNQNFSSYNNDGPKEACSPFFQPIHMQSELSYPTSLTHHEQFYQSPNKTTISDKQKMTWLFGTHRNATVFPVMVQRNPGLGFSISGGIGSSGNPFRPADSGIFVTKVNPDGPASSALKIGDKILEVNGVDFTHVEHEEAVSILKSSGPNVSLLVSRE